ncbi:MAG: hypothetical protein ABUK01_11195 [Leptospirales bacterium]
MQQTNRCKFCGYKKKLIKAHIIPEGFYRQIRSEKNVLKILNNNKDFPKRSPIGIYDENILCKDCDGIFADWDNYAQTLLTNNPKDAIPKIKDEVIVGYEISQYKYDLLKLFFISLLWRASITNHDFFAKIDLGPFESIAKNHIERREPGSANDFSVILSKFELPKDTKAFILDPHLEKWDQINFYRIYLGIYVVYIKVDKRKTTGLFEKFMLKPNLPFCIIQRDILNSKELSLIHDIINVSKATTNNNKPDLK